jgi:hypothetical protein
MQVAKVHAAIIIRPEMMFNCTGTGLTFLVPMIATAITVGGCMIGTVFVGIPSTLCKLCEGAEPK